MARESVGRSIIVDEGDLVIVSNTLTKKKGFFSRVSVAPLLEGLALVGLHPIVNDKSKHKSLVGKRLPNLSANESILIEESDSEFIEGKSFSISIPTKWDKFRHNVGKKLLGG